MTMSIYYKESDHEKYHFCILVPHSVIACRF